MCPGMFQALATPLIMCRNEILCVRCLKAIFLIIKNINRKTFFEKKKFRLSKFAPSIIIINI